MSKNILFKLCLLSFVGSLHINISAESDIIQPFEEGGIWYVQIDSDVRNVTVTKPYNTPNNWSTYYSGIITIPSTVTHDGITYTVTEIGSTSVGLEPFGGQTNMTMVVIPNTVTTIHKKAFGGCSGLTSVVFKPTSHLESIGNLAFNSCTSLKSITFPNSLTYIGEEAFVDCTSLKSINGGNSIELIDAQAFQGLTSLTDVSLSAKKIGVHAFWNCNNLRTVTLNAGVEELDEGAFMQCPSLQEVILPNTLKKIGNEAFRWCLGLQNIVIPNSVNEFGVGVFRLCTGLESVQLSNSLKEIPGYTFQQTGLKSIDIPTSVTSIGVGAFNDCEQLETVTWSNSITTIWDQAFMGDSLLKVSTLPESLSKIGGYAFKDCSSITEITIPSSTIQIGDGAFKSCSSLKTVYNLSMNPQDTPYTNPAFEECDCPVEVHLYEGVKSRYEASVGWGYQVDHEFIILIDDMQLQKATSIIIDNTPIYCEVGEVGTATATILPTNVASHELSWTSSDPSILYIEEFTGQFVGFDVGTVTITATATDGSGVSGSATVYVGQVGPVQDTTPGDVNSDGEINGFDIVIMVDIIMGDTSVTYDMSATDLDGDGEINGFDLVELVDLILSQHVSGAKARRAPKKLDFVSNPSLLISRNSNGEISVGMESNDDFILSQFILELSEGQHLTGISASDKHHVVAYRQVDDNRYSVLCYSAKNAIFTDSRDMLTISCDRSGTVRFSNVMLIDAEKKPHYVRDTEYCETTGIVHVNESFAKPTDIYSISGAIVRKNATSFSGLGHGIYIVDGKTLIIK